MQISGKRVRGKTWWIAENNPSLLQTPQYSDLEMKPQVREENIGRHSQQNHSDAFGYQNQYTSEKSAGQLSSDSFGRTRIRGKIRSRDGGGWLLRPIFFSRISRLKLRGGARCFQHWIIRFTHCMAHRQPGGGVCIIGVKWLTPYILNDIKIQSHTSDLSYACNSPQHKNNWNSLPTKAIL